MTEIKEVLGCFAGVSFPAEGTARVPAAALPELAGLLKSRHNFAVLTDLTAVDYRDSFRLVYHLVRPEDAALYALEADIDHTDPTAPSLTMLWRSALWLEREAYDLTGINFEGHPELRRILLDAGFTGHPLRKDYTPAKRDGV